MTKPASGPSKYDAATAISSGEAIRLAGDASIIARYTSPIGEFSSCCARGVRQQNKPAEALAAGNRYTNATSTDNNNYFRFHRCSFLLEIR